jgi:hypothetical protein
MADGLTLAEYAGAKQLPVDFLRECGVGEHTRDGIRCLRIRYLDVDGTVLATRLRLALSGEHRFLWTSGSKTTLYGWWRLTAAQVAGFVVLVEGESDTQTLWHHGLPALGIPGAATWKSEWDTALIGIDTIYVMIEPDQGGARVLKWLPKRPWRDRVRLVRLGDHKGPQRPALRGPRALHGAVASRARRRRALRPARPGAAATRRRGRPSRPTVWRLARRRTVGRARQRHCGAALSP